MTEVRAQARAEVSFGGASPGGVSSGGRHAGRYNVDSPAPSPVSAYINRRAVTPSRTAVEAHQGWLYVSVSNQWKVRWSVWNVVCGP